MESQKRKANFTENEKIVLVEEFKNNEDVLKPKFGGGVTAKEKERAWIRITEKVNAHNPHVKRTVDEIKKKWHNLTVSMKENLFKDKKEMQKTGGGVSSPAMSQIDHHVLEVIGEDSPAVVGINGGADSLAASRSSNVIASPSDRQSLSTNSTSAAAARITRPGSVQSASKRVKQSLYEDYLEVEMKRIKLDMDRIEAENEKISMEKQKLQLEILKLRIEIAEKVQGKEEVDFDLTQLEM